MLKFLFECRLSLFDVIAMTVIGNLASISLWWALMMIPAIAFSLFMERKYARD